MRGRCLTLLLAFVAWFVVPAAPLGAATEGAPAIERVARTTSPATVERAGDRSDRRTRPELGDDALPGSSFDPPSAALVAASATRPDFEAPFVARTRSSAQPRGPPAA